MLPSSNLCREQEAAQRHRADTTTLANVRLIAETAATAWAHEAKAADKREARQDRVRAVAATIALQKQVTEARLDSGLSENPDRLCSA